MPTVVTRKVGTTSAAGVSVSTFTSGLVGITLLVLGIVALARAGLGSLTEPEVTVGPFLRTPLFALIEIGLGLGAMAVAAGRDLRGAATLAVVTGVAGVVWLIEPGAFAGALGVGIATAWLYVSIGLALLVGVAADRRALV